MANKKITELDALTTPAGADVLAIVDDTDTTTKKVTVTNLMTLAPAIDATNVAAAGALMDSEVTNLSQVKAFDSTDYATAAQGILADSATQPGDLGTAAAKDVGTSNGNVVVLDATGLPAVDGSQLTGISSAVDGTAVTSTGETGATKFLREDGDGTCSFQNVVVSSEELRGTANPHIGAFPNQSFLVTDNPNKSVMVIADADGNLEFVTKDGANVFVNTPSSRLAFAKGFSVQEDGDEPDIEAVTPSGVTYSVISGDSDTKGANGLPTRQGFNYPDIGANPAPILISGGSIA